MNTRLAVIAGTLLVGVSLFVTSLISNNLNNNTLTTSSNAQVACTATATPVANQQGRRPCDTTKGDVCIDEQGNRIKYIYCWWKFTVTCSAGGSKQLSMPACYTQTQADQYVRDHIQTLCSCASAATATPTPPPGATAVPSNTPVVPTTDTTHYPRQVTNTPTPTAPACKPAGAPGCVVNPDGTDSCCANSGSKCINGTCTLVTPTPCISAGQAPVPGRCAPNGEIRCCQTTPPALCFESQFGGQWYARCDLPPATPTPDPTPKPFGAACFYEKCTQNGVKCARDGETCHPVRGGGGDANCLDPNVDCRCVRNTLCAVFNPNDPRAEECWCLDTDYCPKEDGNVPCSLKRAREGKDDCKKLNPSLTCKDQGGFGICDSDFCPRDPGAAAYVLKIKQEINRNPALIDIIERSGTILSRDLLRQGEVTTQTTQSPYQRFLQLFGF